MNLSTYKSKQYYVMHNMASALVEAVNDSAANAMFYKPSTLAKPLKNSHMLTHTKSCFIMEYEVQHYHDLKSQCVIVVTNRYF